MSRDREKRRYTNARDWAEKQASGFSSACLALPEKVQLFKPKAGRMLMDILPYVVGKGNPNAEEGCIHWERIYWAHRGIGPNGDTYLCPRKTANKPCPICEFRLKLLKSDADDAEKLAQDLAPKQRELFNVRNRKDPEKGIQIFDISYFLFGKLLNARIRNADEDEEWNNFWLAKGGSTLKVGWADKTWGGATFQEAETIDIKPRDDEDEDEILEQTHCLDKLLILEDYDKLKKVFLEAVDEDGKKKKKDEEEEEDERPVRRSSRTEDDEDEKPKRRSEPEEEDEPPKKRRSEEEEEDDPTPKSRKNPEPDDDDADWSDFNKRKKEKAREDDEDEKPKRRPSEEEEDEPPRKRRQEEEDEPPKRRRDREEEEDEPPKKRRRDDDEDQETPRGGKFHKHEEEEDEPPKKRRPEPEEEDEPPRKKDRRDPDDD